VSLTPWR